MQIFLLRIANIPQPLNLTLITIEDEYDVYRSTVISVTYIDQVYRYHVCPLD